jgi:hypothetical protein
LAIAAFVRKMLARDSLSHRAAKYFDLFKTGFSDGYHFMFGAYLTLIFVNWAIAFIIFYIVERENFSFANVAFVTAKPTQLCANITCGGFYCSLRLPLECEAESHFFSLENGESQEICYHSCQWTAEVLTSSTFENRTAGLHIQSSTGLIQFPVLEGGKRLDVGITKYTDRRYAPPQDSWRIESLVGAAKYPTCGLTLQTALKQDRRCGAYRLFLDVDEVSKDPMPPLLLDLQTILWVPIFIAMVHTLLFRLVQLNAFCGSVHSLNYGNKGD